MVTNSTPRVYVACLACYNDGKLHGIWIDATDADEIDASRKAMQEQCGHTDNDWAIHDHEGFHGITISESESFEKVAEIAALLEEHGEAYAAYVGIVGEDYATEEGFRDAYEGEYDSPEDYAEEYVKDTCDLPEFALNYFDFEKFARDLGFDGYHFEHNSNGRVYVFRDC